VPFPLASRSAGVYSTTVPPDAPHFAGHFPGTPVLPGIAQIGLVLAAAAAYRGAPVRLTHIVRLRLRHTVGPGDALLVRLSGDTPLRFEIERHGSCVASGLVGVIPA